MDIQVPEKIYIEPTNMCNIKCQTCIRNVWGEPDCIISEDTFSNIKDSLIKISPLPTIFFGGYGEPLYHPGILKMIADLKKINAKVELITNGTILNEKTSSRFIELGLNRLWVSIDGATPENYSDIRLGSQLPLVLKNIKDLQKLKKINGADLPKIGIAFVAMKQNITDLPKVLEAGLELGADKFSISNVIPYTKELNEQILYEDLIESMNISTDNSNNLLPPINIDNDILNSVKKILAKFLWERIFGKNILFKGPDKCPFIESKSTSIRCDGTLSPCLPLMHKHQCYLKDRLRILQPYSIGNINQRTLLELWNDTSYIELRQRLKNFDFASCRLCNSCDLVDSNEEDCLGNDLPACGACLWSQGFFRCP